MLLDGFGKFSRRNQIGISIAYGVGRRKQRRNRVQCHLESPRTLKVAHSTSAFHVTLHPVPLPLLAPYDTEKGFRAGVVGVHFVPADSVSNEP